MNELIPAILAKDEKEFRSHLAIVESLVPVVHLDVMDGAFVPNRTWFDVKVLSELQTPVRFELHLMVKDPARIVQEIETLSSVIRTIWHVEAATDHAALIKRVHELHAEAGLAINPKTPVDALAVHALSLQEILIMGGEPGFSGQELQPHTVERAWEIHGRWPEIPLGFDIGVNTKTIPDLKRAGISRFCAASAIFDARDSVEALRSLQQLL